MARLTGIFTPNLVPLDDRGDIHEAELRRYVDWLIDRGVHGLYPNGSTGEFTRFTVEERRRIIEIVCDQTADGSRFWPVRRKRMSRRRCGRASITTSWSAGGRHRRPVLLQAQPGLGVRVFCGDRTQHAHRRDAVQHPAVRQPIDVPTVRKLAEEFPKIVAIKDSSGDIPHMIRMIKAVRPNRPDFSFLTGWDAALMPLLLIGCDGGTNATSGVVPEITRRCSI